MPFDEQRIPEHEVDPEYQIFKMQDFNDRPDSPLLLTQIEYLVEMFDLQVQNERGKPIVITLAEKQPHLERRRK